MLMKNMNNMNEEKIPQPIVNRVQRSQSQYKEIIKPEYYPWKL